MTHNPIIEEAWIEHQKKLMSFIQARVNTPQDAEDIASGVFTKLIQKVNSREIPDKITPWLYRVTKNSIIDYYRTKKSTEALPEDLLAEDEEADAVSELSHCLLPMIKTLPKRYQEVLILSEIEGKKYQELSDELNLSLPAIKSRILRGRKKLHKSIVACCTILRDTTGNIMDYQQNNPHFCHNCNH